MATPKLETNGKTWGITANYTNAAGEKQRKYKGGFETQAKANKWAAAYIAHMEQVSVIKQNLTTKEVIDRLLYEKEYVDKVKQNTLAFYEQGFDLISEQFGTLRPNQITVLQLQDFINSNIQYPRKCKTICQCLSLLYNYMDRMDITNRNLYHKLKIPKYKAQETKHYDLETYKKLLDYILADDSPLYTPALLLGSLGLRPSEALAVEEMDLQNNLLRVNKAVVAVKRKNQSTYFDTGKTKTEKSVRAFPVEQVFVDELHRYKNKHNIQSPYLCVTSDGEQMREQALAKDLKFIIEKYELPKITPYGLRHTFGQIQKSIKTDIYTISRLMGHSNIATTTRTYFHDDEILNAEAIKSATNSILSQKCK